MPHGVQVSDCGISDLRVKYYSWLHLPFDTRLFPDSAIGVKVIPGAVCWNLSLLNLLFAMDARRISIHG